MSDRHLNNALFCPDGPTEQLFQSRAAPGECVEHLIITFQPAPAVTGQSIPTGPGLPPLAITGHSTPYHIDAP